MIDSKQVRRLIINPSLTEIGLYSRDFEELAIGIMGHETLGGTYIAQLNDGPALGVFEMESATFIDLWNNEILKKRPELHNKIMKACNFLVAPYPKELVNNLKLAVIMCRVFFLRVEEPIPAHDNIQAIADYWKKYWNTSLGKGTTEEFIAHYHKYVNA